MPCARGNASHGLVPRSQTARRSSMKTAASDRPLIFVLFGARGDLTRRLIMPAQFSLYYAGELPREFMLLGIGHGEGSDQDFADYCHACVCDHPDAEAPPQETWRVFAQALHYLRADLDDADSYARLKQALDERALTWSQPPDYVSYMATPPSLFARIARGLAAVGLAETRGVERRAGYYELAGARRDMVQNHLMQLLCLVAMEPPVASAFDDVRNKKMDVLHAVRPIAREAVAESAARGQYGEGWLAGQRMPPYRHEPGVDPHSTTETYAAVKLYVDNWRWQGVPVYLRTGKRLAAPVSEISIRFRDVPHHSFPAAVGLNAQPTRLVIQIQPEEGVILKFIAKEPGYHMHLRPVNMRFSYRNSFSKPSPKAYETLLWDVMRGDASLFMRADQVEAAWQIMLPVLEVWRNDSPPDFPNYPVGSWGPESAELLIARDGRSWLTPTLPQACACPGACQRREQDINLAVVAGEVVDWLARTECQDCCCAPPAAVTLLGEDPDRPACAAPSPTYRGSVSNSAQIVVGQISRILRARTTGSRRRTRRYRSRSAPGATQSRRPPDLRTSSQRGAYRHMMATLSNDRLSLLRTR